MSDIFREVDDALQQEKAAKFWKEYGPTLILAAVVLVVSTGVTSAYRSWTSHQNMKETAKLVMAAEEKDIAAAMEKVSQDTDDGHKAIALMNAASKYASDKNFEKAQTLYQSVSEDKGAPKDLRDLSTILSVRIAQTKDKPDYKALAEKLAPVAGSERSPFSKLARLEMALLYGSGLKDYTAALKALDGMDTDAALSASIKEKAIALKRVYMYEQNSSAPATTPAQNP